MLLSMANVQRYFTLTGDYTEMSATDSCLDFRNRNGIVSAGGDCLHGNKKCYI